MVVDDLMDEMVDGMAEEAARVEAERAEEAARVEAARVEAARVEAARVEAERVEAARVEAARVEVAAADCERWEAERVEAERAEAAIGRAEKQAVMEQQRDTAKWAELEEKAEEAARVEAAMAEAARVEAARTEDAARVEAARVEAARGVVAWQQYQQEWQRWKVTTTRHGDTVRGAANPKPTPPSVPLRPAFPRQIHPSAHTPPPLHPPSAIRTSPSHLLAPDSQPGDGGSPAAPPGTVFIPESQYEGQGTSPPGASSPTQRDAYVPESQYEGDGRESQTLYHTCALSLPSLPSDHCSSSSQVQVISRRLCHWLQEVGSRRTAHVVSR